MRIQGFLLIPAQPEPLGDLLEMGVVAVLGLGLVPVLEAARCTLRTNPEPDGSGRGDDPDRSSYRLHRVILPV